MPGLPASDSVIESPTGCTKQLMSVLCRSVPAALFTRPAGTKPCSIAHRNSSAYFLRCLGSSTCASAVATRLRTSRIVFSPFLAYFSTRTSVEMSWGSARAMAALSRCCMLWILGEAPDRLVGGAQVQAGIIRPVTVSAGVARIAATNPAKLTRQHYPDKELTGAKKGYSGAANDLTAATFRWPA